jgi:hypothetical protein
VDETSPGTNAAIGEEDVLEQDVLERVEPAGPAGPVLVRTRFTRRRDLIAVALIVVLVLVAWVTLWQNSDEHATTSQTAVSPIAAPAGPETFPPSLAEVWRADSAATPEPVATGTAIVTANGSDVLGRDPLTGDVRWRYSRDLPLCTVAAAWSKVVAIYATDGDLLPAGDPRSGGGCSEVTTLKAEDGARDTARNGDAQLGTRLVYDGTYVTTTGPDLLDTWRSDLVQTMEYGKVPAIVNPGKQRVNPEQQSDRPKPNSCRYGSVAASGGSIAVIERCSDDLGDRMSIYKAAAKDSDSPEVTGSVEVGTHDARIVAMNGNHIAVALPDPQRLVVYNVQGKQVAESPLQLPDGDLRGDPQGEVVPTATGPGIVYWFTGSQTMALDDQDFHPLWTMKDTLGAGTRFAGKLLVPVPKGIAVLDAASGRKIGTVPVERGAWTGPVVMATEGPMVLEQRGPVLVALR